MVFLTVFTPTYNRAATLHRVYESLMSQTFKDFEWLVVDDGSTDDTEAVVREWQNDPSTWFPIRYLWQENQHKKIAHNRAVNEARGFLFRIFDSDDRCAPNAFDRFIQHWVSIPENSRKSFSGVCALCAFENGAVVGNRFPAEDWVDACPLEITYRFGVNGDKCSVMRTDVLKQYPFPENIPGFVPEGVVWSRIGREYNSRFVNEVLLTVCRDAPGLTYRKGASFNPAENAVGAAYHKHQILSEDIDYFWFRPGRFIFEAARLTRFYLHASSRERNSLLSFWPSSPLGKLLVAGMYPAGIGLWVLDYFRVRLGR